MSAVLSPPPAEARVPGHFAENVMHFARVLRSAGLPVGTDRIRLALEALQVAGIESRHDFRSTLFACFVDRPEHRMVFDQAFHIFWRDPDLLGRLMAMLLPRVKSRHDQPAQPENKRLAGALFPNLAQPARDAPPEERIDVEASFTWSDSEVLRKADFETMTAAEWTQARRMLDSLDPFFERLRTRRTRSSRSPGVLDWRATLRRSARGDAFVPAWKKPRTRPAPLVVLADISGSMSKYSRMLLHFAHAIGNADRRVTSFVFGTRLTPISRQLRQRDPDIAVATVVRAVDDWSGGTRITACLHEFNRRWSRRVLAQNATVLLISDGLEHGDTQALQFEMERLQKSCHRLVWLNPLLRYDGFEPRAAGVKAMLPWVDAFVPCHSIASLQALGQTLVMATRRTQRFPAAPQPAHPGLQPGLAHG